MTLQDFTAIIDRYGSEPAHWPQRLRGECEALLATSVEARALLSQQGTLDELMTQVAVPAFPGLESRILNQTLPPRKRSPFDTLLEWLLPGSGHSPSLWRPAVAACLPLVFGIVLANYFSFGVGVENDGFQYWGDELTMLSLSDYTEPGF